MDDVMLGRLPHQPEPNEVNRPQLVRRVHSRAFLVPAAFSLCPAHTLPPLAHFPILPGGRGLTE
jgi:hypothetical protein